MTSFPAKARIAHKETCFSTTKPRRLRRHEGIKQHHEVRNWGQWNPWNGNDETPILYVMTNQLLTTQQNVELTCDLSAGRSFFPYRNEPPVPIVAAFGKDRLHQCRLEGSWDFSRAARENREALVRSFRQLKHKAGEDHWEDVIFQFGERRFLCGEKSRIVGYGATAEDAEKIVTDFTAAYATTQEKTGGQFQLIRKEQNNFKCESVTLGLETVLNDKEFALRYPNGLRDWHREFIERLHGRKSGLSILEGKPGTGKISYLRHLMGSLQETHRFYFIPPSNMKILSQPDFIGFWAEQRQIHSDRRLAVILEDADAAVLTRASDNQEQVSALLNLSDGMLGDFLSLQIICTINCTANEIDQALLRPGRLITHQVFQRLDPVQAERLAVSLGTTLPQGRDYSLAEIFAGTVEVDHGLPRMGF